MATDLTQEFCALRDTYIEKQFGRLNEMQRRAVFTTMYLVRLALL